MPRPGRGQLDRERHPVEPLHQPGHGLACLAVQPDVGATWTSPLDEQRHRLRLNPQSPKARTIRLGGPGQRQVGSRYRASSGRPSCSRPVTRIRISSAECRTVARPPRPHRARARSCPGPGAAAAGPGGPPGRPRSARLRPAAAPARSRSRSGPAMAQPPRPAPPPGRCPRSGRRPADHLADQPRLTYPARAGHGHQPVLGQQLRPASPSTAFERPTKLPPRATSRGVHAPDWNYVHPRHAAAGSTWEKSASLAGSPWPTQARRRGRHLPA